MTRGGGAAGGEGPSGGRAREGTRLRLARLARGISQQDLARAAGVSRQAVAGFEAGQWDPSLRVALALARSLETTVEDLFGGGPAMASLEALSPAPLGPEPCRVELAQVGERAVALPLTGHQALRPGFVPAGATARADPEDPCLCEVTPNAALRPSLLVAGCDPALPLLRGPLSRLDPPVELLWWPCGSDEALRLAAAGVVHVAGFHLGAGEAAAAVESLGPLGRVDAEVVHFASWREGLASRLGLPRRIAGLKDVVRGGLRLVNREPGSEARRLLDAHLEELGLGAEEVVGYDSSAAGHLLVASALAGGLADAGITIEPAALAYGLPFVPLVEERFLLAIPRQLITTPEVQSLLRILAAPSLQAQLGGLPGYQDVSSCGERVEAG